MMQGLLIDVVVIKPVVAFECGHQILPRVEPMRIQHVAHAAIETLHHAVGLRPVRRDQSMSDAMLATEPIHPVLAAGLTLAARREAVSKGLAVVSAERPGQRQPSWPKRSLCDPHHNKETDDDCLPSAYARYRLCRDRYR